MTSHTGTAGGTQRVTVDGGEFLLTLIVSVDVRDPDIPVRGERRVP